MRKQISTFASQFTEEQLFLVLTGARLVGDETVAANTFNTLVARGLPARDVARESEARLAACRAILPEDGIDGPQGGGGENIININTRVRFNRAVTDLMLFGISADPDKVRIPVGSEGVIAEYDDEVGYCVNCFGLWYVNRAWFDVLEVIAPASNSEGDYGPDGADSGCGPDGTDTGDIDFNARVIELARAQHHAKTRNAVAQQMRDTFYDLYVKPYDDEIKANNERVAQLEQALRDDALAHVQATGDISLHPAITFRRTTKLVYDKDAIVESLKAEERTEFIRVKEELKVREFEKAWRDGELPWADVEQVNAPTVAIEKLGDIIIALEAGLITQP